MHEEVFWTPSFLDLHPNVNPPSITRIEPIPPISLMTLWPHICERNKKHMWAICKIRSICCQCCVYLECALGDVLFSRINYSSSCSYWGPNCVLFINRKVLCTHISSVYVWQILFDVKLQIQSVIWHFQKQKWMSIDSYIFFLNVTSMSHA